MSVTLFQFKEKKNQDYGWNELHPTVELEQVTNRSIHLRVMRVKPAGLSGGNVGRRGCRALRGGGKTYGKT